MSELNMMGDYIKETVR